GYNNEGAYSFVPTMKDYAFIDYDLVCLYEGYNDMMADERRPNLSVFRRESPVFRLTGYMPIFPIVFKEKAAARLTGDPGALYRAPGTVVFRPGVMTRTAAAVLSATGEAGQVAERQLDRLTPQPERQIGPVERTGCRSPWGQYCRSISDAIELALSRH